MITEQTKITVEFTIHELLHIYDQLIIARDHGDDVQLCDYLCDRITMEIPSNFTESEDYYKPLKRYYNEDCSDDKGIYTY